MKISKIKIQNFRAYQDQTTIELHPKMTVFVGKNDVGKSTILEALDIFFNEPNRRPDPDDLYKKEKELSISVCFSEYLKEFISKLNATFPQIQIPAQENENELEVKKTFSLSEPTRTEFITSDHNIRINFELIWDKIKPIYCIFPSDWRNINAGSEIQVAIKLALKQTSKLEEELQSMTKNIFYKIANITSNLFIEKPKNEDVDLKLGEEWGLGTVDYRYLENLFYKHSDVTALNDIPMKKKGSGVPRLILISFFRNQAEPQISFFGNRADQDLNQEENQKKNTIYAIEEPESSLYPKNQELMIGALKKLSQNSQVLITTHSPAIVKMLADPDKSNEGIQQILESLRIVQSNEKGSIQVKCAQEKFVLAYLSLNEVNYVAFGVKDIGYYLEIYHYLKSQVENEDEYKYLFKEYKKEEKEYVQLSDEKKNKLKEYIKEINNETKTRYITIFQYIRHQIHHPENTKNEKYSQKQFEDAIQDMRKILIERIERKEKN